jgi:hypothetical protein
VVLELILAEQIILCLHKLLDKLSIFTLKFLSERKSFKYFITYIGKFNLINLYKKPTCQTLSKAFKMSKKIPTVFFTFDNISYCYNAQRVVVTQHMEPNVARMISTLLKYDQV